MKLLESEDQPKDCNPLFSPVQGSHNLCPLACMKGHFRILI
jgi:hypothetical protein